MIAYKKLFSLNVFHEYFLGKVTQDVDLGVTVEKFKDLSPTEKQSVIEEVNYSVDSFCTIQPTKDTQQFFNNYKLVNRNTNNGVDLYVKVDPNNLTMFHDLNTSVKLQWEVYLKDDLFLNYSALDLDTFDAQKIMYLDESTFGNYAATPMQVAFSGTLLSWLNTFNETGANIGISTGVPPISTFLGIDLPILDPDQQKEFSDFKGRLFVKINTTTTPIFVNPHLEMRRPLAIVSVTLEKDSSILEVDGSLKKDGSGALTPPEFDVYFDNRETEWQYFNGDTEDPVTSTATGNYPLLKHGYIQVQDSDSQSLPNPDVQRLEESSSGGYISRIYV